MTKDLVSVVMPAYNAEATIEASVQSALDQTHPEVEVIVIDDGSTDGTADLVSARFGDRVTLERAIHGGRGAARNLGLSLATGGFVQYLDADDLLEPETLATQVAYLDAHPDLAGAYGNVEAFYDGDPTQRWPFHTGPTPSGDLLPHMLDDGILLPVGTVVRMTWARRVGGFDPSLPSNEDWDHWMRISLAGGRFDHHPAEGFVGSYRVPGPAAPPRSPTPHFASGVRVLERVSRSLPAATARKLHVRRAIGRWRFSYGHAVLVAGQRWAGVAAMARGLTEDRRGFRRKFAWLALGALLGGRGASAAIAQWRSGSLWPSGRSLPEPEARR